MPWTEIEASVGYCKVCVGTTLGTAVLRRSARLHVILLVIFSSFLSFSPRSLSYVFIAIASRSTTIPFKLDDLRVPIPILPAFIAPFFLFSLIFQLVSHSLEQHNAATTRHSYALIFISF